MVLENIIGEKFMIPWKNIHPCVWAMNNRKRYRPIAIWSHLYQLWWFFEPGQYYFKDPKSTATAATGKFCWSAQEKPYAQPTESEGT